MGPGPPVLDLYSHAPRARGPSVGLGRSPTARWPTSGTRIRFADARGSAQPRLRLGGAGLAAFGGSWIDGRERSALPTVGPRYLGSLRSPRVYPGEPVLGWVGGLKGLACL